MGAILVFDPFGWAAFGPLKWAVVSTLSLATAAVLWLRSFHHHPISTRAWTAFLIWGAISAGFGLDPLYSWIGTPDRHLGWVAWLLFGLVFLVGQNLDNQIRLLARAATVASLGLTAYCVFELSGLAPVDLAVESARVGGPFGSPAYLGAACVLLVPMTAALAADSAERKPWRWVAGMAMIGGTVSVVASQTRAAWVGLAAAAVVAAPRWWPRVRGRWWLLAPGVAIVIITTPIGSRLVDVFEGDLQARTDEWRMGVAVVSEHPLLGVGPEGYRLAFPSVVDADYERRYTRQATPDRAHNGALDTAVTFGLPGLMAYLVAATFIARRSWTAIKTRTPVLVGMGAALIGYIVQQQFLFPVAEIDIVFWLLAGVVIANTGATTTVATPPVVVVVLLGTVSVLAMLGGVLDVIADHRVLASLRTPDAAVVASDQATNLRPDSIRYWLVAANARVRVGEPDAALERMDRALTISPLDPILLAAKGQMLLGIADSTGSDQDIAEATGFYEELLATDPNNSQNVLRAGAAYALAGDFDLAENAFLAAADLAPSSAIPLTNLARVYLTTGELDRALDAYRQAVSIDPSAPGLDEIATFLEEAGANIDG